MAYDDIILSKYNTVSFHIFEEAVYVGDDSNNIHKQQKRNRIV